MRIDSHGVHFKNMKSKEPPPLTRGKIFHKLIQEEWLKTNKSGIPRPERTIKKLSGRGGRIDILVEEIGDNLVSVVEIKATDWDIMAEKNIKRNVRRQIRQIWSYIDSQLDIYGKEVSPGIIFPNIPKDLSRLKLIEAMFNEEGIQVVWHDETMEDVKKRMKK